MEIEQKPLAGYEETHTAYSDGRIWGKRYKKFLKFNPSNAGYLRKCMSIKGKIKNESLHRLIAKTFLVNKNPYYYKNVGHKDNNKFNNCVENLFWCSQKQNIKQAVREGRWGSAGIPVVINGIEYKNRNVAAQTMGISKDVLSKLEASTSDLYRDVKVQEAKVDQIKQFIMIAKQNASKNQKKT